MGSINNFQLIVHAPNVHAGGGRTLLISLLQHAWETIDAQFILDERMSSVIDKKYHSQVKFFKPTFFGRLQAEYWLKVNSHGRTILAFGNLPPIFSNLSKIFLFIQNKYLVTNYSTQSFPLMTRVRIFAERKWLDIFKSHVDIFIVQTSSMKKILIDKNTYQSNKIIVLPFLELNLSHFKHVNPDKKDGFIFIYPASGEPHKNHKNLILSWIELSRYGLYPELLLTLNPAVNIELLSWIELQKVNYNLRITNHGSLSDEEVNLLLRKSSALIYPSLFESFGIPLVIARENQVPIVASELDFIRDVSEPNQTFDPDSAISIARAVKRFMDISEHVEYIASPKDFYQKIIGLHAEIDLRK